MDDADQTAIIRRVGRSGRSSDPWRDRDLADRASQSGPAAEAAAGLASMSFITAAIRRRARLCYVVGLIGLILGAGLFVTHPPAYQATTEVLLTLGPNEDLNTAIDTDVAIAQSRPVAILALRKLGLQESPSALLGSYTAVAVTNKVFQVTVGASSSSAAVAQANAVTQAFLTFRAGQLKVYQQLVTSSLAADVTADQTQVNALTRQVSTASGAAALPAQAAKLKSLQSQLTTAASTLAAQQQTSKASTQMAAQETTIAIKGSSVINAATPIVHSRVKSGVIYAMTGLVAGLALALGFIVISALVSDRLRWRDDVAHALGTPVRLSVGRVRPGRLRRRGLAAIGQPDIQRIADHLRAGLRADPTGAALAVVPADQAEAPALAVTALALTCARQDRRVILADLCPGAPAARLLGVTDPGVHRLDVQDARLVVVVPARGDAAPGGPRAVGGPSARSASADPDLAAAYSTADVLLTLAPLDPMLGAEHLATWAADAVVTVTAGKSSWTRVQAVGEMVRLAGLRLVSGVLIGAEKTDESLGIRSLPTTDREPASRDFRPAPGGVLASLNGSASNSLNGGPGDPAPDHK